MKSADFLVKLGELRTANVSFLTMASPAFRRPSKSLHVEVPCMSLHWSGTMNVKFGKCATVCDSERSVSGTIFANRTGLLATELKYTNGLCFWAYSVGPEAG